MVQWYMVHQHDQTIHYHLPHLSSSFWCLFQYPYFALLHVGTLLLFLNKQMPSVWSLEINHFPYFSLWKALSIRPLSSMKIKRKQ